MKCAADSITVPQVANKQAISVSGTSAQSAALDAEWATVWATVDCYVLAGSNPTATTSCLFIPASTYLRLTGWTRGQKLAFIAGGSGTVHLTPGA